MSGSMSTSEKFHIFISMLLKRYREKNIIVSVHPDQMNSSLPKLDLGFKMFFSLSACARSLGSTIHGKIWIKTSQRKKKNWFRQGSNLRPSACKADVITTTLRNPSRSKRENNIYLNNLSWKQWRHRNKGHLLWSFSMFYLEQSDVRFGSYLMLIGW